MRDGVFIVVLNLLNLFFATILPFVNKESYKLVPYPLFVTGIQTVLSIPLALIAGWIAIGRPRSWSWMLPPQGVWKYTIFKVLLNRCEYNVII